jgi:Ala-tRNA(Pro) deacylase
MVSKTYLINNKEETEAWLASQQIPFNTVTHEPVPTIAAMLEKVKFENEFSDAKFAKNLFFYDKNKKERMWLVICAHDNQFSTKALEKKLGCKNGGLRGATPEVLEEVLGVKGGSVNLFAMLNDKENKKVALLMDTTLLTNFDYVAFHPMQNDFTTAIAKSDVKKIIELSGCSFEQFDFSTLEGAGAPVAAPVAKPAKTE